MLERQVKARIKNILDGFECYYRCPLTAGYGHSGQFDFYCLLNRRFIGIEAKRTCVEKPTGLQSLNAKEALRAGGIVLLIHNSNLDVLISTLERVRNGLDGQSVWPFDGVTESQS